MPAGASEHVVIDQRQVLALAGWLALDLDELRGVRHRLKDDHEFRRQLQRQDRLVPRRQLDGIETEPLAGRVELLVGQIDVGAPEDLAMIFPDRQFLGSVGRNLAHARAYGEGHLDEIVERGFARDGAERAIVFV